MTKFFTKVVKCLPVLLLLAHLGFAQQVVTGKVTSSDDGSAIPGVNVLEKGTTNGTATNSDGSFSMTVGSNATLVFSFVGYATQEVAVGSRTVVDVLLQTDVTALQEVVVIGYGQTEKKDLTGSVVAVGAKEFNRGVLTSPQDLITGRVAGVSVISNGGAPSAGSTIRIRGGSSLNATNDPLIVIDGFPVDNNGISGSANPLAAINPNDIESFTVLKDASATAIYGSRASNGVIIITTKKGKQDKVTFNYNGNVSVNTAAQFVNVMNASQYRTLVNDLASRGFSGIDQAAVAKLGNANTDWQKEIYRDAVSHDHNLNAEGKYKNMGYRVSYGYTDNQGILKGTGFKRNSLNVNINPSLLDGALNINAGLKGSIQDNQFGNEGAVGAALSMDPTQPVRNGNTNYGGFFFWPQNNGTPITIAPANPVALIEQTTNNSTVKRLIGTLQVDYAIPFVEGLKANLNTGFDVQQGEGSNINAKNAAWSSGGPGRREVYSGDNSSKLLDLYLNYRKNIDRHKIEATGGYSYQNFERASQSIASNFDGRRFTTYTTNEKGDTVAFVQPKSLNTLVSLFGRLNYSFDDRFLITATLRNDQSSRFSKSTRSGWFPSVAAAWRLSNESFIKDIKQISNLKLRAGYGITGQQDIGPSYPYLPTYTESTLTAQYQFGNAFFPTLRPNGYDANIRWESTSTLNAGFDLGLFGDRISFTADYYYRETTDLLNTIPVAAGTNLTNFITTNVGSLVNKGIELTLNAKAIDRDGLVWNIGANFTKNIPEITRLLQVKDPNYVGVLVGGISGGVGNTIQIHSVGFPPFAFYPQQQVYNAAGKPLEGLYVDRNGDGQANEKDWYRYKSPNPEFLVGINSNLTYKQFDFSFSGRLSINNYVYNNVASNRTFYNTVYNTNGFFGNVITDISNTQFANAQYRSDYYIENASFFKMDFMSAGYSFENVMGSKVRGRVGLTVRNAFFITKYKGLDPEVGGGIDNNIYPRARVFMLNLSLTF